MQVHRNIENLTSICRNACVTIGNFDGVHRGHLQLFDKVVDKAKKRDGTSVVITFDPHPLQILRPGGIKRISSLRRKKELIAQAGIDLLLVIPFTEEFAGTDAREFVEQVLVDKLQVVELVVGYDYAFGKGRKGDIEFLCQQGLSYGFAVDVVPPLYHRGKVVSSSLIRELVEQGKMMLAAQFLGRPYQIHGTVRYGKQRGSSEVGFPTANLHFNSEDLVPRRGVYVVRVEYDEKCYGGVLNIGVNPTFSNEELVAETHIFDFNKNIYNREIRVHLLKYLRDEVKFVSVEKLIFQIRQDVAAARAFLATHR